MRVSAGDAAWLDGLALACGVPVGTLIREAALRYGAEVAAALRAERSGAAPVRGLGADAPASLRASRAAPESVRLDELVAARAGVDIAAARRLLALGRVRVDGRTVRSIVAVGPVRDVEVVG